MKHVRAQSSNTCDASLGTASSKLANLWSKVTNTIYDPENDTIPEPDIKTLANPYKTKHAFTDCGDTMQNDRQKSIHLRGLTFQARYVAVSNRFGYTGIFENGCLHAIARFSYPTPPSNDNVLYGFAMKFLLDNKPSVNYFGMPSLDGQETYNLFEYNYSNTLAPPSSVALKVGQQSFRMAKYLAQENWFASSESTNPLHLTVDPMAKVLNDNSYKAPHSIICVPSDEIKNIYESVGFNIHTTDFRVVLDGKCKDSKVFDVYAENVETDSKIGEIYANSDFVASSFGDQQLFFQHPL